ncbi:MAG: hypothetical protein KatS3mg045_1490 [Bellilinea sp.]|nr:MAG: hypothetical protein KatS3mg045_1490 [Bellilinea sp.]
MERIYPQDVHPYVWADHIHRYKWASQFAKGNVLDFACGVGYGSTYILESSRVKKYFGADLSFEAIRFAYREYRFTSTNFLVAHSDYLPFLKSSFDTIICFETLEHLEQPERLVEQFASLLKEDGIFIGSVPSREQELQINRIYGENPFHKTKFDFVRLNRLLSQYFHNVYYFKQSLEVGSLLLPLEQKPIDSEGKIIEDISLPKLEHGNLLFVASHDVTIPKHLQNQISFTPALSLFRVDENYNSNLRNLENTTRELKEEKNRLECDLETLRNRSAGLAEELNRMTKTNVNLEKELEALRNQSAEDLRIKTKENERLEQQLFQVERKLNRLKEQLQNVENEKQTLQNTLQEIERSRYWRMIKWLWGQPLYLNLRKVFFKSKVATDYQAVSNDTVLSIPVSPENEIGEVVKQKNIFQQSKLHLSDERFSEDEVKWIEDIRSKQVEVICVLHPEWRGIHASAEQMFEVLLEIPDNLDPQRAYHYACLLSETKCKTVVMSGFPVSYRYLVIALRQHFPQMKIFVIYHGQYNQYREDYDRLSYSTMLNLAKAGKIDKLGFVKAGMAEVIAAGTGVRTGFLMNWVEQLPEKGSLPLEGGPHLGMWLLWSGNWRKPPFTMLASSLLIPNSVVHGADSDERMQEYIQLMNIKAEFAGRPLPHKELMDAMAKMHVNLYVTFHECAPMLPLESLSVGSPMLTWPSFSLF